MKTFALIRPQFRKPESLNDDIAEKQVCPGTVKNRLKNTKFVYILNTWLLLSISFFLKVRESIYKFILLEILTKNNISPYQ